MASRASADVKTFVEGGTLGGDPVEQRFLAAPHQRLYGSQRLRRLGRQLLRRGAGDVLQVRRWHLLQGQADLHRRVGIEGLA